MPIYSDLLEDLKTRVKCPYISDMRFSPYKEKARCELEQMDLSQYPIEMREKVFRYLYVENKNLFE